MGRRRGSVVRDIIDIGAMLPWWVCLIAAAAAYLIFHSLSQLDPGPPARQEMGAYVVRSMIRTGAYFAQTGVPVLLLLGALLSAVKHLRRARLYDSVAGGKARVSERKPKDKLDRLTWRQFEQLVHEYFRRNGYSVIETEQGPDGGIDLRLRKDGRTATVQCKHWRDKKVDVRVVREQLGVMTAGGADECMVVTSGQFTDDAHNFSDRQPITLIDGEKLRKMLGIFAWDHVEARDARQDPDSSCPACGSDMIMRTARRGRNAGNTFWGCSRYPTCRGTRAVI